MSYSLGKKLFRTVAICLVVICVPIAIGEWYVRQKKYLPASVFSLIDYDFVIDHCEPDRELGWVNIPGLHPPSEDATRPEMVGLNRQRRSGVTAGCTKTNPKKVAVFGCSFTYGTGVNDEETYVWKLNENFPTIWFDNYGVTAYGAYQCLKSMERTLKLHPHTYDAVIYAGIMDHACRDFYDYYFMPTPLDVVCYNSLYNNPQHQRQLSVYRWPGDSLLALVNYFKIGYVARISYYSIDKDMRVGTTEKLCAGLSQSIVKMNELAQRHHAKFLFAALEDGNNDFPDGLHCKLYQMLSQRLTAENIQFRDCSLPPEYIPSNNDPRRDEICKYLMNYNCKSIHHPNGRGNTIFAHKIGEWVQENLL